MHKQRSLKPEALALAAGGLSADEVEGVEHGKREPTLSEFFRIARVLGEPPVVAAAAAFVAALLFHCSYHAGDSAD